MRSCQRRTIRFWRLEVVGTVLIILGKLRINYMYAFYVRSLYKNKRMMHVLFFFETKGRSSAAQLRRKKVIMYKKVSQPSSQNGTRGANHPTRRERAQTRHTAMDHRCRAWKQSCQQLGLPMAGHPLVTSRRVQNEVNLHVLTTS